MKQVLDALEAIHTISIEGIHPFLHPYHEPWKLHYPIGSRSLWIWAERNNPLIIVNEDSIHLWNTDFRFPKWEINVWNPHIHYSLCHILWWLRKVSLNHVGLYLNTDDIKKEVKKVIEWYKESIHQVFEDPDWPQMYEKWLFIGDKENNKPMLEFAFRDDGKWLKNHFQIDVDTDMSPEELIEYLQERCWETFIDWKLDIPDVWVVLVMWTTQTCWHYEIRLWIGNNRRNREMHRSQLIHIS